MEKQNRRVWGFENPDIVPVDQDQWERLKMEISSIQPIADKSANAKWGIIGFCGSLVISNAFYLLSTGQKEYAVSYVSAALLVGLLLSAWAFDRIHKTAREGQEASVKRCQSTVASIERRLRVEESGLIPALLAEHKGTTNIEENITSDKLNSEAKPITSPSPKDILSKLSKTNKLGG